MIPRVILDHFRRPRNKRAIEDATAKGVVPGKRAEESITLYLKLSPEGRVADASFTNTGDRQADPSCSVLTELLRGKTVPEIEAIDVETIAKRLESPDPGTATPAHEALRAALAALRGEPNPFERDGRLICYCFHVREGMIRRYIRERHLKTVDEVRAWTRACGGCRSCRPDLDVILQQERDRAP